MRLRFILPLLIALLWPAFALGAFTEFYCNYSTGSNMNGGSDANTSPSYSATNGGWNSGTGVFTPTSGNPSASGVSVGQFAHVFADGGTTPTFIGRVTAVSSTTVTVSTTAKSGTAPGTSGTGISINVGGCWKGPNGGEDFPLDVITNAATDTSGNHVRVNMKDTATYAISASIVPNQAGPITVQGYTSTVGDGGRATIDGSTNTIVLLAPGTTCDGWEFADLIFSNNGTSGSNNGVTIQSGCSNIGFFRCKFTTLRGYGLSMCGGDGVVTECEFTACNGANSFSGGGALLGSNNTTFRRCCFHDITGSNSLGIYVTTSGTIDRCIFDTIASGGGDGSGGIYWRSGAQLAITTSDFYNCSIGLSSYHDVGAGNYCLIENCNFTKNAGYAIALNAGSVKAFGRIINCGFGQGTEANSSGKYNSATQLHFDMTGEVLYTSNVSPYSDAANGNFTLTSSQAKNAGRGAFATGLTSTVGYPDIGAAQHQDSGGGGVSRARVVNPRD